MSLRWYTVVVDCADPAALARWWADTLGWVIAYEAPDEVVIAPAHGLTGAARSVPPAERGPGLVFVPVGESKELKNRLHIDLAPAPGDDQAAAVEQLVARGARRVDVGQGEGVRWVVLADPEGNEFCVLTPRE